MKSLIFFGIIYLILLPLVAIACDKSNPAETSIPPTMQGNTINLDLSDFSVEKNLTRDLELNNQSSFKLQLGSNGSTGFEWGDAVISTPDVISVSSKDFVQPKNNLAGAAGAEVWVFKTLKTGSAIIKLSYSRPWVGGEKDLYTLTINVMVK
jgi:predicted secreted protein